MTGYSGASFKTFLCPATIHLRRPVQGHSIQQTAAGTAAICTWADPEPVVLSEAMMSPETAIVPPPGQENVPEMGQVHVWPAELGMQSGGVAAVRAVSAGCRAPPLRFPEGRPNAPPRACPMPLETAVAMA